MKSDIDMARIALAIIWSIASILTYAGTGAVPGWMLGTMGTCVGWFFGSGERDKVNIRKIARQLALKPQTIDAIIAGRKKRPDLVISEPGGYGCACGFKTINKNEFTTHLIQQGKEAHRNLGPMAKGKHRSIGRVRM